MGANWKSNDWDRLVRGEDCPVCDVIQTAKCQDAHGIAIADLRLSRLFLAKNQYVPGYCVLMCQRHVIEPYELSADERSQFFADLAIAGRVLQTVFQADKPIDPTPAGQEVYLSAEAYAERIALIRAHLDAV